jgi:hypothetical protein
VYSPAPGGGTTPALTFTVSGNPAPTLTGIIPSTAAAGSSAFTLMIDGSGFVAGSTVRWNGTDRTTTYVSATRLTAAILASDIAAPGTVQVTVNSPAPGGGTTPALTFTVSGNPVPTLTGLTPSTAAAGDPAFTLTVDGSEFVAGSIVRWNGTDRTTTYVSATRLSATIAASDIAAVATAQVTVFNPAPGGGTTAALAFTVSGNPAPTLTGIIPSTAAAGSSAFTLTVDGSGFVAGSIVRWNGADRVTTYVSATRLTAAIPASDIAAVGTAQVTVFSPAPGGGTTTVLAFTVSGNPAPSLTGLTPSTAAAGSSAFTLTVDGNGFVAGSAVRWNGTDRTTTFVSATRLTAAIPASDIVAPGTAQVTVFTPAPGGGTTPALAFTISGNPAPTLTGLTPSTASVGDPAFTLTVDGSGFVVGSIVRWSGTDRTTTYVSATRLTASIPASDIAVPGTVQVTVFTPAPGGGTSTALAFAISGNPAPTLSGITPSAAAAGSSAFTLTVDGNGFVAGSIVRWNGTDRTTTYVSATRLTAAIPVSDIATVGIAEVFVFTPAPGGGTTTALVFTVTGNPAPGISGLAPSTAAAGSAAFALTVDGSGFVSSSVVRWNGTDRVTTYVSATRLTAAIPASDIAAVGTAQVTVYSPAPGGGISPALTFTVSGNPSPALTGITPSTAAAGDPAFTLTVDGNGFVAGSIVRWNGVDRTTTYVSATRLTAAIPASDIAAPGTGQVTVYSPAPGGGTTTALAFTVSGNPAPGISGLTPSTAAAGSAAFTLTVDGSGFVSSSVVRWNGTDRTTTYVSATRLTAAIPASDIAAVGPAQVTVFNPAPGGGTTPALTFTVTGNPAPTLTSLTPSTRTAGGTAFTLTVNGTNFLSSSVIYWNGMSRATTYVSGTRLTAAIPASDIAVGGTAQVTVFTPAPGGGTSNPATVTVNNPTPRITSISPTSAPSGRAGFTLTVNGSGFVSASVVRLNGADRTTTYVSRTRLTAAILASDIVVAGTGQVTVYSPAPGGGESNLLVLNIADPPVPAISSLSPTTRTAGGAAFTLTVNGTNFLSDSVVYWNGSSRPTTYVSATRLTAAIPASDIAVGGPMQVTVFTPTPGGGTSNPATVTVNNPAPKITSISPTSATRGGSAFALTVNGSGFVPGSVVRWNGADRATTYVSATRLTVAIPASDIAVAGTAQVTVFNSGPGGGLSASKSFTIR